MNYETWLDEKSFVIMCYAMLLCCYLAQYKPIPAPSEKAANSHDRYFEYANDIFMQIAADLQWSELTHLICCMIKE